MFGRDISILLYCTVYYIGTIYTIYFINAAVELSVSIPKKYLMHAKKGISDNPRSYILI